MSTVRPTLSIDFDGVINPYTRGWQGGDVYDKSPTPGTRMHLEELAKDYRLVVSTARTEHDPVRQALKDWGLDDLIADVTNTKPPAVAYLDDKAIRFKNWPQAVEDLTRHVH